MMSFSHAYFHNSLEICWGISVPNIKKGAQKKDFNKKKLTRRLVNQIETVWLKRKKKKKGQNIVKKVFLKNIKLVFYGHSVFFFAHKWGLWKSTKAFELSSGCSSGHLSWS